MIATMKASYPRSMDKSFDSFTSTPHPTISVNMLTHTCPVAPRFVVLVLILVTGCLGGRPLNAQTATCIGTPDTTSLRLRQYVRTVAAGSDIASVRVRSRLGMATTDSTKVVVMTDSRTCPKILTGVNNAFKSGAVSRPLYVYVIGRSYAAFDKREVVESQGGAVVFLDSKFAPLGVVLAPSVY